MWNKRISERLRNLIFWVGFLLIGSFGLSLVYYQLELANPNSTLRSFGDLYWWWLTMVTGIGHEAVPHSTESRIVGTIIIGIGIIVLGLVISEIMAIVRMIYARHEEGNIKVGYKRHIVVFGYTSLTAGVIKLLRRAFGAKLRIVLISNDVEFNPFPGEVDFIHDNPVGQDTLRDANIAGAEAAIILANDRFRDPDTYSLVIASGIEAANYRVTTIVEVTENADKELLRKTKIDGFLHRRELIIDLLDHEREPKLKRIITKESSLREIPPPTDRVDGLL